jgi:hypothetical protein
VIKVKVHLDQTIKDVRFNRSTGILFLGDLRGCGLTA